MYEDGVFIKDDTLMVFKCNVSDSCQMYAFEDTTLSQNFILN